MGKGKQGARQGLADWSSSAEQLLPGSAVLALKESAEPDLGQCFFTSLVITDPM